MTRGKAALLVALASCGPPATLSPMGWWVRAPLAPTEIDAVAERVAAGLGTDGTFVSRELGRVGVEVYIVEPYACERGGIHGECSGWAAEHHLEVSGPPCEPGSSVAHEQIHWIRWRLTGERTGHPAGLFGPGGLEDVATDGSCCDGHWCME